MIDTAKEYAPVFVGRTKEGEKIVLYNVNGGLFLLRFDNAMVALSQGSKVSAYYEPDTEIMHLGITSPEWTGTARGTRMDLIDEPHRIMNDIDGTGGKYGP